MSDDSERPPILPNHEHDEGSSPAATLHYARRILREEGSAVLALSETLSPEFSRAVDLIVALRPEGRVVVSGMGKAGFVGMKLSATLASIGVPSFFLHPADAVHGDLGRYTEHDVALLLSHSGETPEVLRILPLLRAIGCPIVSMTASRTSALGSHSEIVVEIGAISEAGPLGLAPTTSTTVMMALGDALAMTLLNIRGLTREEYARYHPGGALGLSLLTVEQIMRRGDELCIVDEELTGRETLRRINSTKGRAGAACIVDASGVLVGVFTDGDLRRGMDRDPDFLSWPIGSISSRNPKTIRPDRLAQETLQIMGELKIDEIVVVKDDGRPIGVIDVQDLIELGLRLTV